jgi:hypothetical protein
MAVSTATYGWSSGTFVTASGTTAEVLTELTAGASSSATLQNRDFLISFNYSNGSTPSAVAVWYSSKHGSDWA